MVDDTLDKPRRIHCCELESDRTGIVEIGGGKIELYFIGYGEFEYIEKEKPVFVVTEDAEVMSFHMNIMGRHETCSVMVKSNGRENEYSTVHHGGIISNLAVSGVDPWHEHDLAHRITFRIDSTKYILEHSDKLRSLGRRSTIPDKNFELFHASTDGVSFTAGYSAKYGPQRDHPISHQIVFSIELDNGCLLSEIETYLARYVSFFSFVTGGILSPTQVHIDRMTFDKIIEAVGAGTYIQDYAVLWNWPAEKHDVTNLAFHGAPFIAQNDAELAAFEAGVAAWMNRAAEWDAAYIRMEESYRLQGTISGERLLAAWQWFEEIPLSAALEGNITPSAKENITKAVLYQAQKEGLSSSDVQRMQGALHSVRGESYGSRFERLVSSLRDRFGDEKILNGLTKNLMAARGFRGRVAHGHFSSNDEGELRRFNKATLAMETLCYLLTAQDMPMTDEGLMRIRSHPILQKYYLAFN